MNRRALGLWAWIGAVSPGSRYWTATDSVCAEVRSGTPGLTKRRMRRSPPLPGAMKSGLRSSRGPMSAQRHWNGSTLLCLLAISGPGRDHGASSPASRTHVAYSAIVVGAVAVISDTSYLLQLLSVNGYGGP